MLNEGNQIHSTVSVRTFAIPFYYGSSSGSTLAKSYGSYVSMSATLVLVLLFCVCMKLSISSLFAMRFEKLRIFSYSLFRGADVSTLRPCV
jgi:hypothetical protein